MNISLPPELEEFVLSQVDAGLYATSDEVIKNAISLLLKRYVQHLQTREKFQKDVEEGFQAIARGEYITGEEWKEEIRQRRAARETDKAA